MHQKPCYVCVMPTITVRFSDPETLAALGYLRGPSDDPTRARPSAAAAIRKAILFAAKHGHEAPPPVPSSPPELALAPLLDAWAALCAERGRSSLTTHEVTVHPSSVLRDALEAIGYPLACQDARTLGQTFRHLSDRPGPDGRRLCRGQGRWEGGRILWCVAGGPAS